jgi:hypothetical protein
MFETSYVGVAVSCSSEGTDAQSQLFDTSRGKKGSRNSAVGIATSYGLDDGGVGVQVPVGVRILTSPNRPDRL